MQRTSLTALSLVVILALLLTSIPSGAGATGAEPNPAQAAAPNVFTVSPTVGETGDTSSLIFRARRGQVDFAPDQIVVKLYPGVYPAIGPQGSLTSGRSSLDILLSKHQVLSAIPLFSGHRVPQGLEAGNAPTDFLARVYRLHLPAGSDVLTVAKDLSSDPNVEYAEPDYLLYAAFTPDDPHYPDQWALPKIEADLAWDITQGNPAVAIAIVDTGVDLDHPDLDGKLWVNPGEIPDNGVDDDGNGYIDDVNGWDWVNNDNDPQDDVGHGTHVAGIAAAATDNGIGVAGVCPDCRVMALKVLDATGQGTYSDIAQGITYAADKGARVINLSLGGYADSQLLRDAVAYAAQFSVVVAAAGNDNKQDRFYPAAYNDYVVAVAATDNNDQRAAFSNYGDWVDLSAPGVSIWSTLYDDTYAAWSGSSMAAPFVAGVAGLVHGQHLDWSAGAVRGQLLHTADDIDALNPGYEGKLGLGRLNAFQAVTVTAQPELNIAGYAVNGVPNGHPEPGGAVTMTVSLRNTWQDVASVTAVLNTGDPYVTLTDALAAYGDIVAYSTVTNTTEPLAFLVDASAPYNHPIPFSLTWSGDGGDFTSTLPFTVTVSSGIEYVSGVIDQHTIWTSNQVYIVMGNILVTSGVTLTIEPGTSVLFDNKYYLQVDGTLDAAGVSRRPTTFSRTPQYSGYWEAIKFTDSSTDWNGQTGSIIEHAVIEFGGDGVAGGTRSGAVFISNASPKISNNTIRNRYSAGIRCSGDSSPIISGNTIRGDGMDAGVLLYQMSPGSNPIVQRNRMAEMNEGIRSESVVSATISGNYMINNYTGILLWYCQATVVESNHIVQNDVGIAIAHCDSGDNTPLIRYNSIADNSSYALTLAPYESDYWTTKDIFAPSNWWGTTDTLVIDEMIYDYYDNFDLGKAYYTPTLTGPDPSAPPFLWQFSSDPVSPVGLGPLTLTLDFSKPMSSSIQPTVTFGISPTCDSHTVTGDWVNPTQWAGTYEVTFYTGDGLQLLGVAGAVGDNDGMEMPPSTYFTFEIAAIGAVNVNAEPGYGYVALAWPPSDMETTAGYNVYRSIQSGGPYTRTNDTLLPTAAYTDTGVINGTPYYYVVKLVTTDLLELDYGSEAGATPGDYTAPTTPVVVDDGSCTPYTDRLHASWSASDPESGIIEYQYSIGTTPGGTDVINWTLVATATEVTRTGLSLIEGVTYYINVKARNGMDAWSQVGSSDGILVDGGCPVSNFSASPRSGPVPLTVQFTDHSTGTILAYLWDFGDGFTSILTDPNHVYTSTGIFTVTLTVTGSVASNTRMKPAYITVGEQFRIYLPLIIRAHESTGSVINQATINRLSPTASVPIRFLVL